MLPFGGSTTVTMGSLYECTDGACTKHIFAGSTRVASVEGATSHALHNDHPGGLNFATTENGTVAQHDEYLPFGETRLETGSPGLRHKFTGQEEDAEFGLHYYGARYRGPVIGHCISPDSIVQAPQDPQTLNRHSYCRNNPLSYTDPSGHSFFSFLKSFFSAFIGGVETALTWNPMLGGMAAGAVSGAMEGDWQKVVMGAITGGMGGSVGAIGAGEDRFGIYPMAAVGAGMAVSQGGAGGLASFGAGMLGGAIAQTMFSSPGSFGESGRLEVRGDSAQFLNYHNAYFTASGNNSDGLGIGHLFLSECRQMGIVFEGEGKIYSTADGHLRLEAQTQTFALDSFNYKVQYEALDPDDAIIGSICMTCPGGIGKYYVACPTTFYPSSQTFFAGSNLYGYQLRIATSPSEPTNNVHIMNSLTVHERPKR